MLAKGPLAIHNDNAHRLFHAPTRTTSSGCFMLHSMVMLMITTTMTMTKYVLLTSRGHVKISRFDDKSLQVMEYIEYICVSVFTYAYFISCLCYTGIQGLNYPELPSRGILGNKEIILFDCMCELCGYE